VCAQDKVFTFYLVVNNKVVSGSDGLLRRESVKGGLKTLRRAMLHGETAAQIPKEIKVENPARES
jgi:hypothetical protein